MSHRFRLSFRILCLLLACGLTSSAFAQQQSEPQQPKKLTQNDIKVTQHEDWEVRCPKTGDNKQCEMTQLVNGPKSGKPILRVVMGYPPQIKTAAMIFILPLGTRLAPGVELSVDGDKPRRFPFQICLDQGCRADFPVSDKLLDKLKHGRKATVSIIDPRGKQLDLDVSLQGFTDANDQIAP